MFNSGSEYQQAADMLYKAMKGAGTDNATLIATTARYGADERVLIANAFIGTYGDTIEKWLKGDLSGNMQKLFT